MKNIAVFLDGTQNRCEGACVTNVAKLFMHASAQTSEGISQVKFYSPGVGVYRALDKWTVLSGVGVQVNLRLAYQFVCANYEPDCRIYIFGFSRGAYSARHLAGLIAKFGILRHGDIAKSREIYESYRYSATGRDPDELVFGDPHPIQFLGLWDAVAATRPFLLGKNTGLRGGKLEPEILIARHALALDERRYSFWPERYENNAPQYEEKWFPGYHCDVGGGYPVNQSGLSHLPLEWMIKEAGKAGFEAQCPIPPEGASMVPTPHEYLWTRVLNRPRVSLQ
jgi:uncharacterized protein (DUF2235 family)